MSLATLTNLFRDLGSAHRTLRSRPGYALIATTTLALGIGASVVVFSVVVAVAFSPIPYAESERLVAVWERSLTDPDITHWPVAPATYLDWAEMSESFETLSAYDYRSPVLTTEDNAARVRGLLVTGELFPTLGVGAARGRTLEPGDVEAGHPVAVISDGLWSRAFGRDPEILGREVALDGVATRIVGVMPSTFMFPYAERIDLWRPLAFDAEAASERAQAELFVTGRLAPGVTLEAAHEELAAIHTALAQRHPEFYADRAPNPLTLRDSWLTWRKPSLYLLIGAAAISLTIACLNLAGLMLSRGLGRTAELAVRRAMGAGRLRIAWTLVGEGLLVALAGAVGGTLLATAALPRLVALAPEDWGGVMLMGSAVDGRGLVAAIVLATTTAILASAAPILAVARVDVALQSRSGPRTTGGSLQLRVRRGMVLGQTVLAVFLLGVTGLLGRSLYEAYTYDVGFDAGNVLTARVLGQDEERERRFAFYDRVQEQATALPGVRATTLATIAPLTGNGAPVALTTDGSSPVGEMDSDTYNNSVEYRAVGPEFFDLLGIPLLAGRGFEPDDIAGAERVAVVNERFAKRVFGGASPIGESFRAALLFQNNPPGFHDPVRIVGVVGNTAEWGLWAQPAIAYVPFAQTELLGRVHVLMKTTVAPETLIEPLRDAVWSLGNRLPLESVGSLESHHRELYGMHDFLLVVSAVFGATAVVLAAIGLYGVVALQVGQRLRELSLRMVLGATACKITGDVAREGLHLAIAGAFLAGIASLAVARSLSESWIGNFLHDLGGFDPVSFGLAVALLLGTAVVACLVPARRAARVAPARVLRLDG